MAEADDPTVTGAHAWRSWRERLAVVQGVDEPPPFRLHRPATVDEALRLLAEHPDAAILGGGTELLLELRRWRRTPAHVVSVSGIAELDRLDTVDEVLVIGGGVRLDRIAAHPAVTEAAPLLAEAAASVGTPQLRSQATIGGNLGQLPRCLFLWRGVPCLRDGTGAHCPARDTPDAADMSVFAAPVACPATYGSDLAACLVALDATAWCTGRRGARTVAVRDLVAAGRADVDLIGVLRVPARRWSWCGYRKLLVPGASPLSTVGAAIAIDIDGDGLISDARVVLSGVASGPWRWGDVEVVWRGRHPADCVSHIEPALRRAVDRWSTKAGAVCSLLERAVVTMAAAAAPECPGRVTGRPVTRPVADARPAPARVRIAGR